jgi:transposase
MLGGPEGAQSIEITIEPHAGIRRRCSRCLKPAPGYDCLPQRRWLFVPLWGIATYFCYAPRRVECAEHGIVVEHIPWSDGKRPVTCAMMGFLARWGRRLTWRETARAFQTSWEAVYRSVEWFVEWGLAHRQLCGVESIGVDEIHWGRGLKADNFLTVIYQIDAGYRRLLWVGRRRSQATLRRGLKALGPEVVKGLRFVCSDMWKPYLKVIAAQAGHALHVLDRFHITSHLNQAVDQVRRAESTRLAAKSKKAAQRLKHMRWPLLRRGSRVRGRARQKLNVLLASKLATARAWDLKETFTHFWKYKSEMWAGGFLDYWCFRARRSRLEPMKRGL